MPRPSTPCSDPTCYNLKPCPKHQRAPFESARRSSELYRTTRWRQLRAEQLRVEPHCRRCKAEGRMVRATFVDHVEPHRGDERLFWARSNLQSLCRRHSNAKTAREVASRREGAKNLGTRAGQGAHTEELFSPYVSRETQPESPKRTTSAAGA